MGDARNRLKRAFDIAGALGGLVFFAPAMALACAAILLDDGRPVVFMQRRVGRGREPFVILKLRSMRGGEVTRVGRVLRATGLDELPQLFNILRGDLSAVGPRPLTEADVIRFGWSGAEYHFRWSVRPGLTGPAQLVGPPSPRYALRLARLYIARRSVLLDMPLIPLSFLVNAVGKARARRL